MSRPIPYKPLLALTLVATFTFAQGETIIPENSMKRRVRVVMSADTLAIENGETLDEVWLVCIRTPQLQAGDGPSEYMAKEARSFVQQEIMGKEVYLAFDNQRNEPRRDREARLMAFLYYQKTVESGPNAEPTTKTFLLNEELIRRGMAKVDNTYGCSKRYQLNTLQREARRGKKGVWAVPPE